MALKTYKPTTPGQRQLVLERTALAPQPAERRPQVGGERAQHRLGLGRVVVDQRVHVGQGVEQEVEIGRAHV